MGAWLSEPRAIVDAVTSTSLLLALAVLATSRTGRVVLVVPCAAVLVLQLLVFRYYHAPLDVLVLASAIHAKHDVRPVLVRAMPAFLGLVAVVAAIQYALLALFRADLPSVLLVLTESARLRSVSQGTFPLLPNGAANR
jgi:hypothetical protein